MNESTSSPATAQDYRVRVCRAMNFISHHIDRPQALEEVAEAASCSMYHFHRIFKAVVGETVGEFTRRLRLEQAANRLLAEPGTDITTIAIACGFSSSQNFATAFRLQFGMTPTVYRKSKMANKDRKEPNAFSLQAIYDPDTLMNPQRRTIMDAEVRALPQRRVTTSRGHVDL